MTDNPLDKSLDFKDVSTDGHPVPDGDIQHAESVMDREPYGPPGLRGLVSNPFVFLCAACSTLGGLVFGYDQGVVSVILVMKQFQHQFPEIAPNASGAGFWKGLMTAMIELGAFLGAFSQGWIADKISRRYSIIVAVVVFIIGSVLQTAAVDYAMLTVARLIGGIGIGMLSMVAPLYISEISMYKSLVYIEQHLLTLPPGPPECRGTLLVLEEFCIVSGIVIAYWITFGTRYMAGEWSWRLPFLLQMVPSFVLAAGVIMLPFSPRWLVSKGRSEDAVRSLCKLRRLPPSDTRLQQELMDIQVEVQFHQEMNAEKHPGLQSPGLKNSLLLELCTWGDCFRRSCWRRTHIGVMIMFFQQVNLPTYPSIRFFHWVADQLAVRRHQRSHILFSYPLQNNGLGLRNATYHVRRPERDTASRSDHQRVDNGYTWPTFLAHRGV